MKIYLSLVFLALTQYSYAQDMSIDDVCKLTECRKETKIDIRVTEESYFQGTWPKSPYYFGGTGSVVIGEYLSFEAKANDKGGITLDYVPAKTESSINIKIEQPGDKKTDIMTIATIENNSKYNLIYKGIIYHTASGRFSPTSVCAILSGLSSFESWPYAISLFSFSELKSVTKQEAISYGCK